MEPLNSLTLALLLRRLALLGLAGGIAGGCASTGGSSDGNGDAGAKDATSSSSGGSGSGSGSGSSSGVDSGSGSGADSGSSGGGGSGACAPGTQQCSGNAVETCSSSGEWGSAAPCDAQNPVCLHGACLAASQDGGAVTPPSCVAGGAGMSNCGPGGTGVESCCTSLEVEGGTYYRTYQNMGSGPTGEADQATLSGFRLDRYLVTVGRFRQFVTAWNGGSGYVPAAGSGKHTHLNGGLGLVDVGDDAGVAYETGWVASDDSYLAPTDANLACQPPYDTWTNAAGTQENLPINCVYWYEAYAFCIWDGGFLPSEAEWEYAAAGGGQQREYPWGTTAPGTASQYAIYGGYYPNGTGNCAGLSCFAPVGAAALGAGLWGQLDLSGEANEWNLDWYEPYVDPCVDCAYLTTAMAPPGADDTWLRVYRASDGFFSSAASASGLSPTSRSANNPDTRFASYGIRCARPN